MKTIEELKDFAIKSFSEILLKQKDNYENNTCCSCIFEFEDIQDGMLEDFGAKLKQFLQE
jgi:hypothetical protein